MTGSGWTDVLWTGILKWKKSHCVSRTEDPMLDCCVRSVYKYECDMNDDDKTACLQACGENSSTSDWINLSIIIIISFSLFTFANVPARSLNSCTDCKRHFLAFSIQMGCQWADCQRRWLLSNVRSNRVLHAPYRSQRICETVEYKLWRMSGRFWHRQRILLTTARCDSVAAVSTNYNASHTEPTHPVVHHIHFNQMYISCILLMDMKSWSALCVILIRACQMMQTACVDPIWVLSADSEFLRLFGQWHTMWLNTDSNR